MVVVTFLSAIMTEDLVLDIGMSSLQEVRTELKWLVLQGHREEYQYCSGPAGHQTHFSQAQGHTSVTDPF